MERILSKLFRLFAMLIHIYFLVIIMQIWGFKLKTFLFLTKINFFINLYLFSHLFLNSIFKFDTRDHYFESDKKNENQKHKHYLYSRREMTLIKISFIFSIIVNFLFYMIMYIKRDFMGDTKIPDHVEFFLHGGNTVVILLECFLNKKSIHNNIGLNSKHMLAFGFLYTTLKYLVYFTLEIQIYPMISKISVPAYYMLNLAGYILYIFSCLIFKILFL